MIDPRTAVFVEYCINCSSHNWCTKHNEEKYKSYYEMIKEEVEQTFESFTVYGNTNSTTGRQFTPKLGAFEIVYQEQVVFSKLKTGTWPSPENIFHKIKAVIEGRNIEDINDHVSSQYDNGRSKKRLNARNRQQSNRSYLGMESSHRNLIREARREEKSMLNDYSEDQDDRSLPRIKQNTNNRRDISPARLEGLNNFDRGGHSNQFAKLAYLDGENRVVKLMKDGNNGRMASNFSPGITDNKGPGQYYFPNINRNGGNQLNGYNENSRNLKEYSQNKLLVNPSSYSHKNINNNSNPYENNKTMIPQKAVRTNLYVNKQYAENYIQEGAVEAEGGNDSTVFTQKSKRTDESGDEYPPSSVLKREDVSSQDPEEDSSTKKGVNPKNFSSVPQPQSMTASYTTINKSKGVNSSISKQSSLGEGQGKKRQQNSRVLIDLRRVSFSDMKLSQIKAPKQRITRKKITMIADEEKDCKIEAYSTIPEILPLESNEFIVQKGSTFKLPLRIECTEDEDSLGCFIFLLKDGRPWQKIIIEVVFT